MRGECPLLLFIVCWLSRIEYGTIAFHSVPAPVIRRGSAAGAGVVSTTRRRYPWTQSRCTSLSASNNNNYSDDDSREYKQSSRRSHGWLRKIGSMAKANPVRRILRQKNKVFAAALAVTSCFWIIDSSKIQAAHASAPVMAIPKAEQRDPATEAILNHDRKMTQKAQADMQEFNRKAREIEMSEGEAARAKFEKEYKIRQEEIAAQKVRGLEKLKRNLLDEGIDPFTDLEGKRQMILYKKGIDLGEVPGTQFNLEKEYEAKNFKKSRAYKKQPNRKMIQLMVQDMKNRGIDPVEYFEKHQEKSAGILDLPAATAVRLAQEYETNLEKYGQITVPKEGEMSVLDKMAEKDKNADPLKAKEEAKRMKAEAKKKAAEEKAQEKARLKEEKQRAKEEAKATKEAKKQEKLATKAAAVAATSATAAAAATSAATGVVADSVQAGVQHAATTVVEQQQEVVASTTRGETSAEEITEETMSPPSTAESSASALQPVSSSSVESSATSQKSVTSIAKVAVTTVAVGAGGYAIYMFREKEARDEEERQRQFRLLMGGDASKDDGATSSVLPEKVDGDGVSDSLDLSSLTFDEEKHAETPGDDVPKPTDTPPAAPSRKRTRGIKNVFSKKNRNNRETDLSVLVSDGAKAPEFSTLLAKILTFGAPGRFPGVIALPGEMPMQKFVLESAQEKLIESRVSAGLTDEESAEVFASVVNCMLIDIIDLASSSLKEKDDKVTVNAIGIVVDFMNHAASLYKAVAGDVVIEPVTYGGDLSKSKLEQMYSAYAVSGMMDMANIDENFDSRVSLLQTAFQISEKKAEGLMMKAMQKNMMKMLKSGEGMEGMADMLQGMGGLDGMGDLAGLMGGADGEGPSPEQLKEMLLAIKEMKDSGAIPQEELETVKSQFKEAFGSTVDDVIKEGDTGDEAMSQGDKELLDLMKSILGD